MCYGDFVATLEVITEMQALADKWAEDAQEYVGYWHGVNVRGVCLAEAVHVDEKPWVEPLDESDDCSFCALLSPERIADRILGFQHELEIEFMRVNLGEGQRPAVAGLFDAYALARNTHDRQKCHDICLQINEQIAGLPYDTEKPHHRVLLYDFCSLPYYLQYRLCARWNHTLRSWLMQHPAWMYNFKTRAIEPNTAHLQEKEREMLGDQYEVVYGLNQEAAAQAALDEDDHIYAATAFGVVTEEDVQRMEEL